MALKLGGPFSRRGSFSRLQMSSSAAAGFGHLARAASRESPVRAARRATLAAAALLVAAGVLLSVGVLEARGAEDGGRRYMRLMREVEEAARRCDAGLGKRRRWLGGKGKRVVGEGYCVSHEGVSRAGEFPDAELRFMVVGDWGRDGMCCQRDVAVEMGVAAVNFTPGFVANVGDSFYPSGLGGVRDEQVDTSWKGVYGSVEGLAGVVWRSVLGNHDYRGDVDAQIELTEKEPLWHMPARWYFEEESDGGVLLAFLDTTPLYYDEDEMDEMDGGLGGEAPAAAAQRKKVRDAQISAVAGRLKKSSARVKLVFGHHPLFSSAENALTESAHLQRMIRHLAGILSESGVTAYFSGHEHTMEHTVFGGVHYFVVGSGSKVNPVQMLQAGSVFALGRQGFAMVAVEDTVVHVQFVDMTGHVVHATSIGPGAEGAAMEAASREQALVSVMAGGAEAAGPSLLEEVAVSA